MDLHLEELRETLRQYFGTLNEISMGLKPESPPEKPEAFIRYEQCREMGIPLVQGGLMDQPHIWLLEYAVCMQEQQLFEALNARSRENGQSMERGQTVRE